MVPGVFLSVFVWLWRIGRLMPVMGRGGVLPDAGDQPVVVLCVEGSGARRWAGVSVGGTRCAVAVITDKGRMLRGDE